MKKNNIAIFASGSGSNAENISRYFMDHPSVKVSLILTNKPDAPVIDRAKNLGLPVFIFTREDFYNSEIVLEKLRSFDTDYIILAGFLWLIPPYLISNYRGRMINIHPALLPAYGGKGMYGARVHQAVVANKEKESGITIHFVNEEYDAGDIIFQARYSLKEDETPDSLAARVHELEYEHFPKVIEKVVTGA